MRIQNNITAMNTHRQYTINNENVAKNAEKLSSGYRINRAGDDAAGLAISEKMRSQIRGLNMATKNSQDAISLVQTAEGALQETQNMLQRMNELAVQAATGTNEDLDRTALAKEFEQLKREINDIAEQTTFNNMKILDGSMSYKGYQRSAATAGLTFTEQTAIGNAAGGSSQPPTSSEGTKGVVDVTLDSAFMSSTIDANNSKTISMTDDNGNTIDVTFKTDETTADTLANLADGGKLTVEAEGYDATIDKDGKLTLTQKEASDVEFGTFSTAGTAMTKGTVAFTDGNGSGTNAKVEFDLSDAALDTEIAAGESQDITINLKDGSGKDVQVTVNIKNSGTDAAKVSDLIKTPANITASAKADGTAVAGWTATNSNGKITAEAGDDTATGWNSTNIAEDVAADVIGSNGTHVAGVAGTGDDSSEATPATAAKITIALDDASIGSTKGGANEVARIDITIDGEKQTLESGNLKDVDSAAGIANAFDGKAVTFGTGDDAVTYTASVDDDGNIVLTSDKTGKTGLTAADVTTSQISFIDSNDTTGATAGDITGVTSSGTFVDGTDEVQPEEEPSGGNTKDVTFELDFAKMKPGDQFTVTFNGTEKFKLTGPTENQTRESWLESVKGQLANVEGAELKGNSIIFSKIDVKTKIDAKLSNDTTKETGDANSSAQAEKYKTNALRIQVGALENEQLNISIDAMTTKGLGIDDAHLTVTGDTTDTQQNEAGKAITMVRNAINMVSDQRATLGAMQNRLDHKIANLKVASENLSASESRIRDVDMASEMTQFTKNNILSQAATAMLAQANALPQNVLSLLG